MGTRRAVAAPVLDDALVEQLELVPGQHGPTLLHDLVPDFLASLDDKVTAIDAALQSGDVHEAARCAHVLSGSFGTLGARPAATALAELESAARLGAASVRLRSSLTQLRPIFDAAAAALRVRVEQGTWPDDGPDGRRRGVGPVGGVAQP